jgi:peptide/nickel transport system substrate-binding protein
VFVVLVGLSLCLAGCKIDEKDRSGGKSGPDVTVPTSPAQPRQPARGDILIRGDIGDASVLLPILANDVPSNRITDLIFSGLLKYDKDIRLVGDLAERWDISEDQLRITFHLRKNVKWHDGKPFTADDVEYTYRAYVDPDTPTAYASAFMRIERLRVLDSHTVEVVYKSPYAPALGSWVVNKILPRHLMEGAPVALSPLKRNPVGAGPYKFKEWKTGEKIVLEANQDYYAGRPYLDTLVVKIVPDQASLFLQAKGGQIDQMKLTPMQFARLTSACQLEDSFKKYRFTDFGYVYLGYNLSDRRFTDKRVRQALTMALDRESIVKGALLGLAQVAHSPYKPDSFWHNLRAKRWPYDPKRAKEQLAEAGWIDSDSDGLLDKDGKPFEFTIITNHGNETRKNAAVIMQKHLREIGVKVNIRLIEWAAFIKDFLGKRNFDVYLCGWISEKDPDAIDQWNSAKTGEHQFNYVGYKNEEADRLLELGVSTFDPAERKKCYDRFQEILAEDLPVTFLWVSEDLQMIHQRFHGIAPAPMGLEYNLEKWYVPTFLQKHAVCARGSF